MRRSPSQRSLVISLAAVVLVFGLFVAGVWKAGFLQLTAKGPPAEALAAAVTLVGGLVASAVTVIGLILKHSADERLATLQEEAEERLKLEAGLRAAALFATPEGNATPPVQRAAALYTLASLRQHDLVLDLAFGMLESGDLDVVLASGILDRVFQSDDQLAKRAAISRLLGVRAQTMILADGIALPSSLSYSPSGFDDYVRSWLPDMYAHVLLARPVPYWRKHFDHVGMIVGALGVLWLDEKVERIRNDAGVILYYGLAIVDDGAAWLEHPARRINWDDVRQSLAKRPESRTTSILTLIGSLEAWSAPEPIGQPTV